MNRRHRPGEVRGRGGVARSTAGETPCWREGRGGGAHLLLLRGHERSPECFAHEVPHLDPLDIVRTHGVVPKHLSRGAVRAGAVSAGRRARPGAERRLRGRMRCARGRRCRRGSHLQRALTTRIEPKHLVLPRVKKRRRRRQQRRLQPRQPLPLVERRHVLGSRGGLEGRYQRHERRHPVPSQRLHLAVPLGVAPAQRSEVGHRHRPKAAQLGGGLLRKVLRRGLRQQQAEQLPLRALPLAVAGLLRSLQRRDQEGHEWVSARLILQILVQVVDDVKGGEPVLRPQHFVVEHQAQCGRHSEVVGADKGPLESAGGRLKGRGAQDLQE